MPTSNQPAKAFSRTRKTVPQTTEDIRALVEKYGATEWGYKNRRNIIAIEFVFDGFLLRFLMDIPDPSDSARKHRVLYDRIRSCFIWIKDEGVEMQEVFGLNIVDPETDKTTGEMLSIRIQAWRDEKMGLLTKGDD